ncbi:unnamed protein product [Peniophora sp. CBMAI 1063]|nr:unnamed protein product [Peniophora sp. CBMAI 1063]
MKTGSSRKERVTNPSVADNDSTTSFDSSMSASASNDHDTAVGILDPQQSSRRREMLALINKMRSTGAQLDLDLPVIAVIGSQSAGKSSLVESVSGITLPRASGTCTRCPTECLLAQSDGPWSCIVSLRLVTDEHGAPLDQPRTVQFGSPIFQKEDVTERIRRAQLAILNPSHDHERYIEGTWDTNTSREISFSSNCVCLHITGKDLEDLSFVDLPGFIVGGEAVDRELVQKLAEAYISKPSCIILLTVACETDFENQSAHRLAEQHDPHGTRTIGVLTKPDRIPKGEEETWIHLLNAELDAVDYFCIKNPASQEIKDGVSWELARTREREFFESTAPWATLDWHHNQKLGTDKLTARLGKSLTNLIVRRLPQLQEELEKLLETTESSIDTLPSPPSSEPVAEILQLVGKFTQAVERQTQGIPSEDGLLQSLRPAQVTFQHAIRITAPDFRPFDKPGPNDVAPTVPIPSFLTNEERDRDSMFEPMDDRKAIYVDDVMAKAQAAVTRELPNNYPFVVTQQLIVNAVSKWGSPADTLFNATAQALRKRLSRISSIVFEHLRERAADTQAWLSRLQIMERNPFTRNDHYFADYREKFLTHYKAVRRQDSNDFIARLDRGESDVDEGFRETLNSAMASIHSLGFHEFAPANLPRLLPPDSCEAAIEIMADVRAYFQVAYKRYIDNVPMTIDYGLVSGMNIDLGKTLYNGLGVGGVEGFERCRRLLEEPEDVSQRRDQLVKRRERLRRAREELLEVFA